MVSLKLTKTTIEVNARTDMGKRLYEVQLHEGNNRGEKGEGVGVRGRSGGHETGGRPPNVPRTRLCWVTLLFKVGANSFIDYLRGGSNNNMGT
jgi:hypothetical protein